MSEKTGMVAAVSHKQLASGTYHSFCVDDTWFRTGKVDVNVDKGYKVKFNYETDSYGNQVDVASLKFKEGEAPPPQPKKAWGGKKGGGASDYAKKEKYWQDKELRDIDNQKRISFNAAMNTAINFIQLAITNDCVKVPSAKSMPARFAALQAMVDEQTRRTVLEFQNAPSVVEELLAGQEEEELAVGAEAQRKLDEEQHEEVLEDDEFSDGADEVNEVEEEEDW